MLLSAMDQDAGTPSALPAQYYDTDDFLPQLRGRVEEAVLGREVGPLSSVRCAEDIAELLYLAVGHNKCVPDRNQLHQFISKMIVQIADDYPDDDSNEAMLTRLRRTLLTYLLLMFFEAHYKFHHHDDDMEMPLTIKLAMQGRGSLFLVRKYTTYDEFMDYEDPLAGECNNHHDLGKMKAEEWKEDFDDKDLSKYRMLRARYIEGEWRSFEDVFRLACQDLCQRLVLPDSDSESNLDPFDVIESVRRQYVLIGQRIMLNRELFELSREKEPVYGPEKPHSAVLECRHPLYLPSVVHHDGDTAKVAPAHRAGSEIRRVECKHGLHNHHMITETGSRKAPPPIFRIDRGGVQDPKELARQKKERCERGPSPLRRVQTVDWTVPKGKIRTEYAASPPATPVYEGSETTDDESAEIQSKYQNAVMKYIDDAFDDEATDAPGTEPQF